MEIAKRVRQFKWARKSGPASWREEVLFFDSDDYFTDLISGLDQARYSIQFETYIFRRGRLADRISQALSRAASRGVQVQLLVDGVGSPAFWWEYGSKLQAQGVQVRLYRALPWEFHGRQLSLWQHLRNFFGRLYSLNKGNHRKTCVIDGEVGWVSSCNVSDQHLKSVFGEAAWVDAGLRVRGDELRHLTRAFAVAFKGNILQSAFLPRDSLIFINSSYLLRKTLHHDQLRRLRKARERVWLQTPYFVPIPAVYRRLRRLARKGVDVRLMVPAISDVPVVRYMGYAFFKGLLKSGVQIYEYQPRFMHQKITHVDDWITLGSANLNHRSFIHDLEIHVVITKPENQQLMKKKFLEEQEFCKVLTVENLNQRLTWAERALGRVLLLLRYWT